MSLDMFKLDSDVEVQEESDSLGKFTFDTDVYKLKVKLAYLDESKPNEATGNKGGARSVNIIFTDEKGKELRITEYVTSGLAKGQKPYYEKDGKKFPLPGYSKMNDFFVQATGKGLAEQAVEAKKIKLYDVTQRKEVPVEKQILMDALGKEVYAGVIEVREDKHNDPSQKVTKNEVDKWFDGVTKLTTAEKTAGKDEPKFVEDWVKKWKGQVKDKTTKGAATTAGAPTGNGADTTNSLFT